MEQENLKKHLGWILPLITLAGAAGCVGGFENSTATPASDLQPVEPTPSPLDPNADEDGDGLLNGVDENPLRWDTVQGVNISNGLRVDTDGTMTNDGFLNPDIQIEPGEQLPFWEDSSDIEIDLNQVDSDTERVIFTIGEGDYDLTHETLELMMDETSDVVLAYIERYTGLTYSDEVLEQMQEYYENADMSVAVYNEISLGFGAPMIPAGFANVSEYLPQTMIEGYQEGDMSNEAELADFLEPKSLDDLPPLGYELVFEKGMQYRNLVVDQLIAMQGNSTVLNDGYFSLSSFNTGFLHDPDLSFGESLDPREAEPEEFMIRIVPSHTNEMVIRKNSDYPYTEEEMFELTLENELVSAAFRSLVCSLEPAEQDRLLAELSETLNLKLDSSNFMQYSDAVGNALSTSISVDRLMTPEE